MSSSDLSIELDKWKDSLKSDYNPVIYTDLQALICSLESKAIGINLFKIIPLSLQLLDHHHIPNKLLGLKCIIHIKNSVSLNDLKNQGVDMLFLHTLKKSMFVDSDEFLQELLPIQLTFLTDFKNSSNNFSEHVDDIFDQIIQNMELTSKIERKRVYWAIMPSYILFLELSVVKYSKRIVSLLEDQLSYPVRDDVEEMFLNVIQTVQSFIVQAEPRIKHWQDKLFFILIKFYHSNHDFIGKNEGLRNQMISTLQLLKKVDETSFMEHVREIESTSTKNANVEKCLALLQ